MNCALTNLPKTINEVGPCFEHLGTHFIALLYGIATFAVMCLICIGIIFLVKAIWDTANG